jgi:hypothetical protein
MAKARQSRTLGALHVVHSMVHVCSVPCCLLRYVCLRALHPAMQPQTRPKWDRPPSTGRVGSGAPTCSLSVSSMSCSFSLTKAPIRCPGNMTCVASRRTCCMRHAAKCPSIITSWFASESESSLMIFPDTSAYSLRTCGRACVCSPARASVRACGEALTDARVAWLLSRAAAATVRCCRLPTDSLSVGTALRWHTHHEDQQVEFVGLVVEVHKDVPPDQLLPRLDVRQRIRQRDNVPIYTSSAVPKYSAAVQCLNIA